MNAEHLKPCPFCGKTDTLRLTSAADEYESEECEEYPHINTFFVVCDASHPGGPGGCGANSGYKQTPEKAIRAWQARAQQQAASVPDGWQLVPKEATDEMIEAAGLYEPTGSVRAAWRDMLAAARNPPLPRDRFAVANAEPRIGAGPPTVPADVMADAAFPPILSVGRMVDNKMALLVVFDRELSDDELRTIDDVLHAARAVLREEDLARLHAMWLAEFRERAAQVCQDERNPYSDEEWRVRCDLAEAIRALPLDKEAT